MTIPEVSTESRTTFTRITRGARITFERDAFWAVLVAALTFAIYVSTLAPGVIGIVDTPKFQFIGRVLGVSHNPGYPLYSVLTHVFGYLPIGSLAYRINLFSAIFGALACAVAYLLARQLGGARVMAFSAAIAFACGSAVWAVSTVAEVYTLHVFLIAGILLALVRWRQTRRAWQFYLAVVLFAIGEGHHTDIALMIPAIVVYACFVEPRFALRARTIVVSALICVAGLLQYGFIILRTRQGAYVESPARNISDLVDIVRGKQFAVSLLPFDPSMLLHDRLPLVSRMFLQEVSAAGLVLAALGVLFLALRGWREAVLLLFTVITFAAFGLMYGVADIAVFMIPAYLACWVFAGIAATSLAQLFERRAGMAAMTGVCAASLALPVSLFARNHQTHDLSYHWSEIRYLEALFAHLPEKTAIVREDFLVDRLMRYKTLGEDALHDRRVVVTFSDDYGKVADLWRQGYSILAFTKSARLLRFQGADFSYAPYQVKGGSLDQLLGDLPPRSVVAIAVPRVRFAAFARSAHTQLRRIGAQLSSSVVENAAVMGVVGGKDALEETRPLKTAVVHVLRGGEVGSTGVRAPIEISAEASQMTATIRIGPREILRTRDAAVAIWDSRGTLLRAFALASGDAAVPVRSDGLELFALRRLRDWEDLPSKAVDVTSLMQSGNVVLRLAPRSAVTMYLGRMRPLAPAPFDMPEMPQFVVAVYRGSDNNALDRLARDLARDGIPADGRLLRSEFIYRVRIATPRLYPEPFALQLALGGIPDVVWARTSEGDAASSYAVDLSTHLESIDLETDELHMARDHHAQLIGSGWSEVQTDDIGAFRRMDAPDAELLIPAEPNGAITLSVQAAPAPGKEGAPLRVVINGHALSVQVLQAGWSRYDWDIPEDFLETVNSVVLSASAPGAEVSDVLVIRGRTRQVTRSTNSH